MSRKDEETGPKKDKSRGHRQGSESDEETEKTAAEKRIMAEADERRKALASRAAYAGHFTRQLKALKVWTQEATKAASKKCSTEHEGALLEMFEYRVLELKRKLKSVEEVNQRVLENWDQKNPDTAANTAISGSRDPEAYWMILREEEKDDAIKEATEAHNLLKLAIQIGDAKDQDDAKKTSQEAIEAKEARRQELRQRFKIEAMVGKFNGKESLDYIPFREQWTKADLQMGTLFEKGEKLTMLRRRLEGEPLDLIRGLLDVDDNYQIAFDLLDNRYKKISREIRQLLDLTQDQAPMMGDSRSRQQVLNNHMKLMQRLDGLNVSFENRYELLIMERIEKDLDNTCKREWYKQVEEHTSMTDPLGTTLRSQNLIAVINAQIHIAEQMSSDKFLCEKNEKIRTAFAAEKRKTKIEEKKRIMGKVTQTLKVNLAAGNVKTESKDGKDKNQNKYPNNSQNKNWNKSNQNKTYETPKKLMNVQHQEPQGQRGDNVATANLCPFCGKEHKGFMTCRNRMGMNPNDQLEALRKKSRCFSCGNVLDGRHNCSGSECATCKGRHLTELHAVALELFQRRKAQRQSTSGQVHHLAHVVCKKDDTGKKEIVLKNRERQFSETKGVKGLLRVIEIPVKDSKGGEKRLRVALDSQSQLNLITAKAAELLGKNGVITTLTMMTAGGKTQKIRSQKINAVLVSKMTNQDHLLSFYTIETISSPYDKVNVDPKKYPHLEDLEFSIVYPEKEGVQIDMLIGEPYYTRFDLGKLRKGKLLEPAASLTEFGWVLSGNNNNNMLPFDRYVLFQVGLAEDQQELHQQMNEFFYRENLGLAQNDTEFTLEEQTAIDKMNDITVYDDEQRKWITGLLWKKDPAQHLQNNYGNALRVMESVSKKLTGDLTKRILVDKAYHEMIDNGFAEIVPADELWPKGKFVYFLESHPVLRMDHATTKCRIVMNASSKDRKSGLSLNNCLYAGPCLLPAVALSQVAFRTYPHVMTADVSKMFLQILLHEQDKDALRFVWRFTGKSEPTVMRAKTLTFGLNSSPFQADYCVKRSANDTKDTYPEAAEIINNNSYVDDLVVPGDTEEEMLERFEEVRTIYDYAGMTLHKIGIRRPEILQRKDQESAQDPTKLTGILGLVWHPKTDRIVLQNYQKYKPKVEELIANETCTKRQILALVASMFDSTGLISPIILKGKLLIKKVWETKAGWDDQLEHDLSQQCLEWAKELPSIENASIKRLICTKESRSLYVFCDASTVAYGACAYLKTGDLLKLVFSKTRVTPKSLGDSESSVTIARLELLAAVVGVKIANYIADTLKVEEKDIFYFTDSAITLARIRAGPENWKIWVGTRIRFITATAPSRQWHYVPTTENPADVASRGSSVVDLIEHKLWWKGPTFIFKSEENWPKIPSLETSKKQVQEAEMKPSVQFLTRTAEENPYEWIIELANRKSKISRVINIVKTVIQFCNKLLAKTNAKKAEGMQKAWRIVTESSEDLLIYKAAQSCITKEELNKSMHDDWTTEQGLIVYEPRSSSTEKIKKLIVLPKGSHLTELMLLDMHELLQHGQFQTVLGRIYQKFKVMGGRREIKRIMRLCKKKFCRNPMPVEQKMGNLPIERTSINEKPFLHISLDYWGPILYRSSKTATVVKKAWGCLFTCMTTRAIHIELVDSNSAIDFLMAFRRFAGRRGTPKTIWSDNATTFKAANDELKLLYENPTVKDKFKNLQIEWTYSSPKAPFENGVTERVVSIVKKILIIQTQNNSLPKTALQTVLCEVESIVNSRPLGLVSEGDEIVTPFLLVNGRHAQEMPDMKWTNVPVKRSHAADMWKARREFLNQFWKKYRNEYLQSLEPRRKWKTFLNPEPKIGDVVIMRDDNVSRNEWRLAKVLEIMPDRQGVNRYAMVQSAGNQPVRRHFNRLALLEQGHLGANEPLPALPVKRAKKRVIEVDLEDE